MKTRINREGKSLTNVNIWLDSDVLGELTQQAGRQSSAGGTRVKLPDVIRAALKRAAEEGRQKTNP